MSTGRLVDAVWGTRAPASALGILRTYVHRLRKALGPAEDSAASLIRSTGDGHQLRTPPDALDLGAFRELLARAEQACGAGGIKGAAQVLDRRMAWIVGQYS
ncbi:AfsR/SARP family transcriptional regulator [Streptomyces griseoruber]|uniref:AfsR/SARP family transcriptional regulator n=1 Tax=Streptomyces griseoruber TaxID=1943 RepID=UPI000A514714|nr:hypothetical protein [Streptomyces griseoruber]